jgi:hypothetical protein
VGPRFSGKVREEPQRREKGGGKVRNQDFRDSKKTGADVHLHIPHCGPRSARSLTA